MPSKAAAAALLLAAAAAGQGDKLVSKSLNLLLADRDRLYAFAEDSLQYSRIDLFADPVEIRNDKLPFEAGVRGGVGRSMSLLLYYGFRASDSVTMGGIASLDRDGSTEVDSLAFVRSAKDDNGVTGGVQVSALALWRDTVVVGGGRAGIALARPKASGGTAVLGVDSLFFQALPSGVDTAVTALRCPVGGRCRVDGLTDLANSQGAPDEVLSLAVDSSAADSAWILIGTAAGLRRGLLGGNAFPKVALPGDTGAAGIRIERIHADPANRLLWVFSGSRYFFSDDHGATFRVPPDVPGVATKPGADLKGFNPVPEAASLGDTTYVNFNLFQPGLVLFRRDTVLKNAGTGAPDDVLLDAEDSLPISLGQGKLTDLAALRSGSGSASAVAVGTDSKGLIYRVTGPGRSGEWKNLNSLKSLKGGLDEIITFPTAFTGGTGPDGQPEHVKIGYRLKKDGKVTITLYNYAMEKVKVLVKNAPRKGGGPRSEVPAEDRWDGRDRSGRLVSVGIYYILVESDKGEKGWGKAVHIRGRN